MQLLPITDKTDLVEQNLGNELLIFNLTTNKAYALNETSMIIFNACNGTTSFDDLKRKYNYTDDLIHLTLSELKRNDLVDYQSDYFNGLSRREVVKRVGLASMIALPVIAAIAAPSAANAASSGLRANNQDCTNDSQCASGVCTADSNFAFCCAQTASSSFPLAPGEFFQSSSDNACTSSAASFCCSAMATFNSAGSGTCTCT